MSSNANDEAARTGGAAPLAGAAAAAIGRYRWLICSLLFLATTINYVDRQILALCKEFLDKELGWTNEQFGLVNSAFLGAYGVGVFAWGRLIDRYGTKIGYAWSIATWSVAAMAHALVASVGGFLGARMFLGVSRGRELPGGNQGGRPVVPQDRAGVRDSALQLGHERRRNRGADDRAGHRAVLGLARRVRSGWCRRVSLAVPLASVLRRPGEAAEGLEGRVRLHPPGHGRRRSGRRADDVASRARAQADLVVHRGEVHDRSGLVVLPDLAARLLQGDAESRHQAQLDPRRDHLL